MNTRPLDLTFAQAALDASREVFTAFAHCLAEENRTLNLTRIETPEQIHSRHFLDSLAALPLLDEVAATADGTFNLIDVGSGAGFPGLAIAVARPQWRIVSLEATEKKVRFQQQLCTSLGLSNVQVVCGRAEALAHDPAFREQFCAATSRAVAELNVLAELTLGFVRPGGVGLFWKGPQIIEEIASAQGAFEKMGAQSPAMFTYSLPEAEATPFYLTLSRKDTPTPNSYPRSHFAAIKKRPLR